MKNSKFNNFKKSARKINNINDIKKGDLLLKTVDDWFYFGIVLETLVENELKTKIFFLDHMDKFNIGEIATDHHIEYFSYADMLYFASR